MLSPAQFAELLELIQMTRDVGTKSEVRRAQRLDHPCRITIAMGTDKTAGAGILVQLKDISARGMCFLHNQALVPAAEFVARLESCPASRRFPSAHTCYTLSNSMRTLFRLARNSPLRPKSPSRYTLN